MTHADVPTPGLAGQPIDGGGNTPRRAVLKGACVGALAVAGGAALAACGGGPESGTTGTTGTGSKGVLAQLDDIPVGSGEVVKGSGGKRYVLVRTATDSVTAFDAACTHQGCPVAMSIAGVINCPCHGSRFDVTTGNVLHGPATKPLKSVAVSVTNGEISLA